MFRPPSACGQTLFAQPSAVAFGTGRIAAPATKKHAQVHLVFAFFQPREKPVETAEFTLGVCLAINLIVARLQFAVTVRRQAVHFRCEVKQLTQFVFVGRSAPRRNGTFAKRLRFVRYDESYRYRPDCRSLRKLDTLPRTVETEQFGRRRWKRDAAIVTMQSLVETDLQPIASVNCRTVPPLDHGSSGSSAVVSINTVARPRVSVVPARMRSPANHAHGLRPSIRSAGRRRYQAIGRLPSLHLRRRSGETFGIVKSYRASTHQRTNKTIFVEALKHLQWIGRLVGVVNRRVRRFVAGRSFMGGRKCHGKANHITTFSPSVAMSRPRYPVVPTDHTPTS